MDFRFGVEVTNVLFEHRDGKKTATALECRCDGKEQGIPLTENDLVFVTNGSCTEGAPSTATRTTPPNGDADGPHQRLLEPVEKHRPAGPRLWPSRGNSAPTSPRPTGSRLPSPPWTGRILPLHRGHLPAGPPLGPCGHRRHRPAARTPAGCSAGPSTARASSKSRTPARSASGSTACSPTCPGDYIQKPMKDCTGCEITQEWLYHIGVPVDQIPQLAAPQRRLRPHHDALYHRFLYAPRQGGPPRRHPRRLRQFCLPGPVCRHPPGYGVHHRILGAHRHGGRLRPAGSGPRRARGSGAASTTSAPCWRAPSV